MNWEQIKGIVERVVTIGVVWAVGKGYVPQAVSADLVALVLLAGSVIWGWKVNTSTALTDAAKAVK